MQLVESLVSGVRGAEDGHAELYNYGTSTRATYYADFEGTVHSTTGADLTLDSNGASLVYVNQLVDIKVFDSSGVQLRDFTEGESAPATEVISNSFTGVNRTTGVSAAGQPTTLQAILDLWFTSAGAIDWKVLFNGTATNLQVAVAAVAGLFFNVKDPTYGAKGDGATDDTTAIQNCMNAAGAVKGTVIFPAGTYRHTSVLSPPTGVSLWGVGSAGSVLSLDHGTADQLSYNYSVGGNPGWQEIRNLALQASQSNNGKVITVPGAAGVYLAVYATNIGSTTSFNTGTILSVGNNTSEVMLDGCLMSALAASNSAISAAQTNVKIRVKSCRINIGLGAYNGTAVLARNLFMQGSTLDMSSASSGTNTGINVDGTAGYGPKGAIVGCELISPTGGTTTAISITNANEATTSIAESGNIIRGTWTTVFSGFTAQSNIPSMLASTRQCLGKNITDNTASVNVLADQYGYTALTRTTTAAQTVTTSVGAGGADFLLIVFNNSGGGLGNITFGAGFASGTPAITGLANGKLAMQKFKAVYVNGAAAWVPTSPVETGI